MEIGTEISQKIRSAIKAKLVELGAYVDDELPDYIMVMVANKKSQAQMTSDLCLFLGTNTEKFTLWLHSLLKKLQTLTTDEQPAGKEKVKTKDKQKSDRNEKRKKVTAEKLSSATSSSQKPTTNTTTARVPPQSTSKTTPALAPKVHKSRAEDEEKPDDFVRITENTDEFSEELREDEDKKKPIGSASSTTNVSRTTSLKATSNTEPVTTKQTQQSAVSAVSSVKKRTQVRPSAAHNSTASNRSGHSSAGHSSANHKKPVSVVASVKRQYEELDKEEEEYDPYNPAVGSVASVIKVSSRKSSVPKSLQANKSLLLKAVNEAEKSVTTTKRNQPPEERENSNTGTSQQHDNRLPISLKGRIKTAAGLQLISRSRRTEMLQSMKYTVDNETEDSKVKSGPIKVKADPVEFTVTNLPAKFSIKGATAVESASQLPSSGIANMKYTVRNEHVSPPKRKGVILSPRISPTKPAVPVSEVRPTGVAIKRLAQAEDSIVVPPKRRAPLTGGGRMASVALQGVAKQSRQIVQAEAVEFEAEPEDIVEDEQEIPDSRRVQCDDADVMSDQLISEELANPPGISSTSDIDVDDQEAVQTASSRLYLTDEDSKMTPDPEIQQLLLEDMEEDFTVYNEENERQQQYYIEDNKRVILTEPKSKYPVKDPKFIVTLDGVDSSTYEQLPELMEHSRVFQAPPPVIPVYSAEVQPMFQDNTQVNDKPALQTYSKITPPKIKPFNINLKDTDDEEEEIETEEEPSPEKLLQKSPDRCKFWPACANGNACPYAHPTVTCKTFPYCKFGDKCLYIHPNCKFDAKCTRKDCPFTHASRRPGAANIVHKIVQVPVPIRKPVIPVPAALEGPSCKFFPNCRNVSCPFVHPKPCRYGTGCMTKTNCSFYHPPLPTKDKMKWSASTAAKKTTKHISERRFDGGDAKPLPTPT